MQYVLIALPLHQWLRERALILRYSTLPVLFVAVSGVYNLAVITFVSFQYNTGM